LNEKMILVLAGLQTGEKCNLTKPCTCSSAMVMRYQKRISDPLLNRIDIHVQVLWIVHRFQGAPGYTPSAIRPAVITIFYCCLKGAYPGGRF